MRPICDEYAQKDTRIRVVHQVNHGLSSARNKGLKMLQGQYVAFVDSDDLVYPCFLDVLYNAAVQNNADASACSVKSFEDDVDFVELVEVRSEILTNREAARQVCENKYWMPVVRNKLYKASLFRGCLFPPLDFMRMRQ